MKVREIVAAGLVLLASGVASAQDLPVGYGVDAPSGSKFTTELRAADQDDYIFDGYVGANVTLKVTKKKAVTVAYVIELQRPDGSVVTEGDGLKPKTLKNGYTVKFRLDATGVWKARVKADGANGNEYTLHVKYGGPKVSKLKNLTADGDGEFKLVVPAQAGARVSTTLSYKGNAPTFVSFKSPNGLDIDGFGDAVSTSKSKVKVKNFTIPVNMPIGNYPLVFAANGAQKVNYSVRIKRPKLPKKVKADLDPNEPLLQSLNTNVGGAGTLLIGTVKDAVDSNDLEGLPRFLVGNLELENVTADLLPGQTTVYAVIGTVPASVLSLPLGTMFDVQVKTSTGQTVVMLDAFELVAPPVVTTIVPFEGSAAGGYPATISGDGFRDALNTRITIDDFIVPVTIDQISSTEIHFNVPSRSPGFARFGVQDAESQLTATLPVGSFEYLATPGINRITPGLISVLGGEPIFISGKFFTDTDRVFMELIDGSGNFEEITATTATFVTDELHSFPAPVGRSKGRYEIYILDSQGVRSTGNFFVNYFTYADFTPNAGLTNPAGDIWDASSTFAADFDNDGDEDLFLTRHGDSSISKDSHTRVLQNDGSGNLTEITASVMPTPTNTDDWRGDRIWLRDLDEDTYPDIVLTTNSDVAPATDKSHTRLLMNVARPGGTGADDRVFQDKTVQLFAAPRTSVGFTSTGTVLRDNWRGLDMWVGDLDIGAGPPDIVITHDELKEEKDILCGNYCSSPYATTATYNFYWGGSRAFRWDPNAAEGEGQYKFDFAFFPHKQGLVVPIGNAPPGVTIPNCNNNTPCQGKFTPFVGQRIAAGFLDTDLRTDIAVLSKDPVQAFGSTTSSLQVLLNRFNPVTFQTFTDMTSAVFQLGGDSKGDSVTIGNPTGAGTIVTSKASAASGATRVMRAYEYSFDGEEHSFADVSAALLPRTTSGGDSWQASAMRFIDVDEDGDQDLVVLANQAPGLTEPGFRILRNVVENNAFVLKDDFSGLIEPLTGTDFLAGDVLTIGDIDGDEALDFYISRATPIGLDTQTRVIKTDK